MSWSSSTTSALCSSNWSQGEASSWFVFLIKLMELMFQQQARARSLCRLQAQKTSLSSVMRLETSAASLSSVSSLSLATDADASTDSSTLSVVSLQQLQRQQQVLYETTTKLPNNKNSHGCLPSRRPLKPTALCAMTRFPTWNIYNTP